MFEIGIIVLIGVSLIFWLRRSKGASQCSGCSGCSYQRPDASEESTVDLSFSLNQLTLDRVKSGKYCRIKSLPSGVIMDQTIRFGLTEGKEVFCQAVIPAGPVVLKVDRQEIALGRNLAKQIGIAWGSGKVEK
ncbi:MAG: ferrous iron transport protein A [Firmicutes bacterium]|nr:ferrous iron transport protein A [Bacillota bacterium]